MLLASNKQGEEEIINAEDNYEVIINEEIVEDDVVELKNQRGRPKLTTNVDELQSLHRRNIRTIRELKQEIKILNKSITKTRVTQGKKAAQFEEEKPYLLKELQENKSTGSKIVGGSILKQQCDAFNQNRRKEIYDFPVSERELKITKAKKFKAQKVKDLLTENGIAFNRNIKYNQTDNEISLIDLLLQLWEQKPELEPQS